MGLRKFQIAGKRIGLTLLDYFSPKVWLLGILIMLTYGLAFRHEIIAIFKKINSKLNSVELFEVECFYIEDNWIPK